jgi:hypothetical protein
MENQISKQELKRELENTVNLWVDRSFNFIQVAVLEKYCNDGLVEHIRNMSVEEAIIKWLGDCDTELKIKDWATETTEYWETDDLEFNLDSKLSEYRDFDGSIEESFISVFGSDKWHEFTDWCLIEHEEDIDNLIAEQENYPMWNTCFEFREKFYNSEEFIEICLSLGLGVIEGLDDFNNIVFMKSAGHSFYSAYWIPLYFKLFPLESEKYAGIDYQDL